MPEFKICDKKIYVVWKIFRPLYEKNAKELRAKTNFVVILGYIGN